MAFIRKSAHTLSLRILGTILSIFGVAVVTKTLGPANKGIFTVFTTTLLLVGAFTNFGVGTSNVYLIARKKKELNKVASNSLVFAFVFGLTASIIFLLSFEKIQPYVFPELKRSDFLLIIWLIPIIHIQTYFRSILQGLNRIIAVNYIEIIFSVILNYSILILLLYLMDNQIRAVTTGYFIINLLLAVALAGAILLNKGFKFNIDWATAKQSLSFGIRERVGEILDNMVILSDRYFLAYFHGLTSVGIYSVSCWLAERLWYIPTAISFVLYPEAASLSKEKSSNFVPIVCRNTLLINSVIAVIFLVFGRIIISTLFGGQFGGALMPMFLLIPGALGLTLSKTLKTYMLSEGKPHLITCASITAFITNMILNYTLIPTFGTNGAAIATSTSYIIYSSVILCFFVKLTNKKISEIIFIQKEDFVRYHRLIKSLPSLNPANAFADRKIAKVQSNAEA